MATIHPTAIIDPTAVLADDVEVGPYAIIEQQVRIGQGSRIGSHACIGAWTELGEQNQVFHMSSIGAPPQDLRYKGEPCRTRIGNNNVFREFSTVHRGTPHGHAETVIGNNNLMMAYSHVAHDCVVGNGIVMANAATLAGHVTVEDNVILGGLVAIHQFVTIGAYCMLGGGTMTSLDVPPFMIVTSDKRQASLRGLNLIGLKRRGFSDESIRNLKDAYKTLFMAGLKLPDALKRIKEEIAHCAEVTQLVQFIEQSQRGICRG